MCLCPTLPCFFYNFLTKFSLKIFAFKSESDTTLWSPYKYRGGRTSEMPWYDTAHHATKTCRKKQFICNVLIDVMGRMHGTRHLSADIWARDIWVQTFGREGIWAQWHMGARTLIGREIRANAFLINFSLVFLKLIKTILYLLQRSHRRN